MIFKIALFPFLLIKFCIQLVLSLFRFIFSLISNLCRFSVGRIFGTLFGACIGAIGGSKHLKIKWFPKKK
jgi:hypothetical protein